MIGLQSGHRKHDMIVKCRLVFFCLLSLTNCKGFSQVSTQSKNARVDIDLVTKEESLRFGQKLHDEECQIGFENYGRAPLIQNTPWSDDDFVSHSVGKRNAGPDEGEIVENSDVIFQSKNPLVSQQDCQELIDEARNEIASGLELLKDQAERQSNAPTNSELGEARVSTLPRGREWLREEMHSTFFPLLQNRFGVRANKLTLHDALIIGYGYFGSGSRSQPVHRDSSLLSLNVALSPRSNYTGGGTYFEALGHQLHQEQGHLTCHAGGIMHAGTGISQGERWILVLFVIDESRPQLARRCHFLGLDAQRRGQLSLAQSHFQASLGVHPNNHLVYKDLGRCFHSQQPPNHNLVFQARQCLAKTIELYPLDAEASLGLAKMLVHAKLTRAALRRLDTLLSFPSFSDEEFHSPETVWLPLKSLAWEARVLAVQCALQCCSSGSSELGSVLLPAAEQRLESCLKIAPSPYLESMMESLQKMKRKATT
mmetsp:Transcript_9255/g.14233  ORF Transcript_9255/g.14233 Transcript_9255/m.14233 type:complete len:483 (+) Transcript_9255:101-1549(+)